VAAWRKAIQSLRPSDFAPAFGRVVRLEGERSGRRGPEFAGRAWRRSGGWCLIALVAAWRKAIQSLRPSDFAPPFGRAVRLAGRRSGRRGPEFAGCAWRRSGNVLSDRARGSLEEGKSVVPASPPRRPSAEWYPAHAATRHERGTRRPEMGHPDVGHPPRSLRVVRGGG
jgi:hypothetical protein